MFQLFQSSSNLI